MSIVSSLTILGLGIIDPWLAVPAGLAMKLSPVVTAGLAITGGVGAAAAVSVLGERRRLWLDRWLGLEGHNASGGRVSRLWAASGVAGFGFVAPLLIGGPESVLAGLLLGARGGRLLFWVSLGTTFWIVAFAAFGTLALGALPAWLTDVLIWGSMALGYIVLPAYIVHRIRSRRKARAS